MCEVSYCFCNQCIISLQCGSNNIFSATQWVHSNRICQNNISFVTWGQRYWHVVHITFPSLHRARFCYVIKVNLCLAQGETFSLVAMITYSLQNKGSIFTMWLRKQNFLNYLSTFPPFYYSTWPIQPHGNISHMFPKIARLSQPAESVFLTWQK